MNQSAKIRPVHTLERLHLVLEFFSLFKNLWRMAVSANAGNCFLKFQSYLCLLAFQDEIREASFQDSYRLLGRAIPFKLLAMVWVSWLWNGISSPFKSIFAPNSKPWVGVSHYDSHVMSDMHSSKMFSKLFVGVDINHPLTINESRKTSIVHFSWHGLCSPVHYFMDNLNFVKEHANG